MSYPQAEAPAVKSGVVQQANTVGELARRISVSSERIRAVTNQIYGPVPPSTERDPSGKVVGLTDNMAFAISQLSDAVNTLERDINILHAGDR